MPAHAEWVGDVRAMMGTEVRVLLWDDDPDEGKQLVEQVFEETARIDRLMSTYILAFRRRFQRAKAQIFCLSVA